MTSEISFINRCGKISLENRQNTTCPEIVDICSQRCIERNFKFLRKYFRNDDCQSAQELTYKCFEKCKKNLGPTHLPWGCYPSPR